MNAGTTLVRPSVVVDVVNDVVFVVVLQFQLTTRRSGNAELRSRSRFLAHRKKPRGYAAEPASLRLSSRPRERIREIYETRTKTTTKITTRRVASRGIIPPVRSLQRKSEPANTTKRAERVSWRKLINASDRADQAPN